MECEFVDKINFEEYNQFLKHNSTTFYNSSKFLKLLEKLLNAKIELIELKKNNELIGALPYIIKNSKYGNVVNSLPFFGSYGGIISKENENKKIILEKFNELKIERDILSSVLIENPFEQNNQIYKKYLNHNFTDSRITQCTKLEDSETELFSKLEKRVRWSIKKAEKNGIDVKKSTLNKENKLKMFELHKKNMLSKNAEFKSLDFFEAINKIFEVGKDYDIFIGIKEDIPISYLLVFYFKEFTEYYMPVQNMEYRNTQASSKLIFESMYESIKKKIKYYNFGGTPKNNQTLHQFKKGWNAIDYNYKYYISADLDRINDIPIEKLKKIFQNFYIIPYDKIKNS